MTLKALKQVSVAFGLLSLVMLGSSTPLHADLIFYKATEDKKVYAADPNRYERVRRPPRSATEEIYVERAATLKIPFSQIKSVVVEKAEPDKDLEKAVDEAFRSMGKQRRKSGEDTTDYTVTFYLNDNAAKKLNAVSQKHGGQSFDVRVGRQSLVVATLHGPFDKGAFSVAGLTGETIARLKEILSPIKNKVTWK